LKNELLEVDEKGLVPKKREMGVTDENILEELLRIRPE
jgi:hypothetical protein